MSQIPNEFRPDEFDPEKTAPFATTLGGDEFYWKIDEPSDSHPIR